MPRPPRAAALAASTLGAIWTAFAAWLSLGTIGFATAAGPRIGLLPLTAGALTLVACAALAVVALLRAGAPRRALSLLALVVLPWIPIGAPPAFLIWSGPIVAAIWIAVAIIMIRGIPWSVTRRPPFFASPGPLVAGVLALLVFGAAAWRAAPSVPQGDEPHYLVITQSLFLDGDLIIDNNHRRGDYRAFYDGDLAPHVQRLGRGGKMYSIHAPGLPALVLPAFAIAGYHGVVILLLLVAAAGAALAWWLGWLATQRADAAWFGWAAVTFPVTAVFHSFSVYPDAPGGGIALTGVWALLRADAERRSGAKRIAPWFWHGVALAVLPWLHSRFAVIAGTLGALILLRLSSVKNPAAKAVAFLSVPAVSAMLWLGFFIALYGRPDPSAPYAPGEMGSLEWVPGGLAGLLFDQRFGLLPYAPVLACAFIGLSLMLVQRDSRRLALELLFVMVPYLLTVTHFAMWWGGWSAPARFFTPVLPLLAIPAAMFWVAVEDRRERPLALAALAFTVLASVVLVSVDRGRLAYNVRDTPALWLEWLSRTADLPQALPWWTRGGDAALFRDIAVWVLAFAATVGVMRLVHRSGVAKNGSSQEVAWAWALALMVMLASTAVWALRDADGRVTAAAQLHLLRTVASSSRAIGVELDRVRPMPLVAMARRIRIERSRTIEAGRPAGRDDRPLFEIPRVPAGVYRLQPVSESPRGWLMIGIGRDQFAIFTLAIASPPQPIDLRFPIPVRGIVVRGDEEARQSVRGVVVEPVAVVANDEWRSLTARRAVKYPGATVFFLDDRSFPEPEGFWVRGSRSSSFVVQPDSPRPVARLLLRNGPVANNATMTVARSATDMAFAPGEERYVNVPIDVSRGASLVTLAVAGGFRPSDHDPRSRDTRSLGIWVAVR